MVTKIDFDPTMDGFAFSNGWYPIRKDANEDPEKKLDKELAKLDQTVHKVLQRVRQEGWFTSVFGLVGQGIAGVVFKWKWIRAKLKAWLAGGYGLCGGMAFVSADLFMRKAQSLPSRGRIERLSFGELVGELAGGLAVLRNWVKALRREDENTEPGGEDVRKTVPLPGGRLYFYLFMRQVDSFRKDLARFLVWIFYLKRMPKWLKGGRPWLAKKSRKEWVKLTSEIDRGNPVPLGLVRDTTFVSECHQVLAVGYDDTLGGGRRVIYVYDPNCPDNESEIRFLLEGEELRGRETCNRVDLMGFFCEKYKPVDPEGFWGEGVLDGS